MAAASFLPAAAFAEDPRQAGEEIEVVGHYLSSLGTESSASSGTYTHALIEDRPLVRPGEIEELVPGVIVTQHSGAGKANQFFLRGFNLDHGTDFASTLEGVPLNLPSHAHGQGYLDLNFLIPELVARVDYFKGPYFASKGDFSSAGGSDLYLLDSVSQPLLSVQAGSFGYARAFAAASPDLFGGKLLLGLEAAHEDGPWQHPDDYAKYNAVLRYTRLLGEGALSVLAQGYSGEWNATDQIPLRAVQGGALDRYGAVDPSDGGRSHRFALSARYDGGGWKATIYGTRYDLDLFSDFTFFLDDRMNGDQVEQAERRFVEGFNASYRKDASLLFPQHYEVGIEGRIDHVDPVGLFHTRARERLSTVSQDGVTQSSGAVYGEVETRFTRWLRFTAGLRGTLYDFDVRASDPRNSGTTVAGLLLPKARLTLGPFARTQLYLDFGEDYHSNDARGVNARFDAQTGLPLAGVSALPRSTGYEAGARTEIVPHTELSIALWLLDLSSELVWDADAATTVPSPRTRREGVEFSARAQPLRWLLFDLDASLSRARFRDFQPRGQFVPEGVGTAISAGATVHRLGPWSASLFMRYFGPRALNQDDTVRSSASLLFNAQSSYRLTANVTLDAQLFNIFDSHPDDIAYFYPSRLPNESPAGRDDIHFHPAEPRSFRAALTVSL